MKSNSVWVLACLVSMPVFAQSLPDEINYGPYQTRYQNLERDTRSAQAKLSGSQASLAETQKFISEMVSHLEELRTSIRQAESSIASLRAEIPVLEREISSLQSQRSQVESEIRVRQNEDSQLNYAYQNAQRDLNPLEDSLRRKEQRLRELQNELSQHQRVLDSAESRLRQTASEASRIDSAYTNEERSQRQMEQELRTADSRYNSLQGEISRVESTISSLRSQADSQRGQLSSLDGEAQRAQSELATLRSQNAPAPQIQAAQARVSQIMSQRNNISSAIRNTESQISREESKIGSIRSQMEGIRRDQQSLPGRIAQSQSRQRQLEAQRRQLQGELSRYQSEVQNASRNVEARRYAVDGQMQDVRREESNVARQRSIVEDYVRRINSVRSEINNLSARSRTLSSDIGTASAQINENRAAIPRLEQGIREDQAEIKSGESELAQARVDERNLISEVARDEAKLAETTRARDTAQGEMSSRLGLYRQYEAEAESIGVEQAGAGTQLGEKEGQRLAGVLSKQNGQSVGRELGASEAKHWGSVRGEIQGYELGYSEGTASSEDRTRAATEATSKATVDAELFAQTNFKPVFFEEHVQAEFKKPLGLKIASLQKSFQSIRMSFAAESSFAAVAPLTSAELSRSEELKTPLDGIISQSVKDVKAIEAKGLRLAKAEVAFETPTKIPFGTVSCARVYKGLAVFKATCEGAYKGAFTNNYIAGASDTFEESYPKQYRSEFDAAQVSEREAKFGGEFAQALKVGRAEGVRVGKIDIYERTYTETYKTVYDSELVKAKAKAKTDAANELVSFLKVKPLLTLSESKLEAENFRGSEEVTLSGKVKNVSSVALQGPVMVRLTEVVNGEKLTGEVVLNSAAALGVTQLPNLKVKILPTAKAGEKLIVRGVVDLPGDLYRPARQEKFELVQLLSANPAMTSGLKYDNTPSIKGVFSRYVHFLDVKIQPTVEDIPEGYQVSVKAVGDTTSVIEIKEGTLSSGAIAANASKDVRFSYTFKDAAKNKTVNLEIAISYQGKVIKSESIVLKPH